jgi:hypothetical protein
MSTLDWSKATPADEAQPLDWSQAKPLDWGNATEEQSDPHAARLAGLDAKVSEAQAKLDSGEWEMGGLMNGHVFDGKILSGNVLFDSRTGDPVGDTSLLSRYGHMTDEERGAHNAGAVRSAAQGATLGFADELEADARTTFAGGAKLLGFDAGQLDYNGTLADIRARNAQFAADEPGNDFAMKFAGGVVVPGLGAASNVARTAGLGARMLTGARAGVVIGGAEGAGSSEGGFDERAARAVEGAALGAVVGGGLPLGSAIVAGVAKPLMRGVQRLFGLGADAAAQRTVNEALAADAKNLGVSFEQHVDDLNAAASEGGFNSVAHVAGPNVQRAFVRAQKAGADTSKFFVEAGDHATRAREALTPALGTRAYSAQHARLTAARKAEADTAYADVYALAPQDMSALHPLQSRAAFRDAIATANQALEASGAGPIQKVGTATAGHDVHKLSELSVEQADQLGRALQGQVDEAFANPKLRGSVAPALAKLRDTAQAELDAAFPELVAVRARYAEQSGPLHALEAGRSIPLKAGQAQDDAVKEAAKSATRNPRQFGDGANQAGLDTLANHGNRGVDTLMSEAARPVREAMPVSAQQALEHESWLKRVNETLGAKPGTEAPPVSMGTIASAIAQAGMGHTHGAARTLAAGGLRGLVSRGAMSRKEAEVLADVLTSRHIVGSDPAAVTGPQTRDAIMRALAVELAVGSQ